MHFTLEMRVDGHVSVDEVRRHVHDRLGLTPYLRRRLSYPWPSGRPYLVDAASFDIAEHVVPVEAVAVDGVDPFNTITTSLLPRDRPLWLMVVDDRHDKTTIWWSVHHAIMDGGLLGTAMALLFSPEAGEPASGAPVTRPPSRALLSAVAAADRGRRALGRLRRRRRVSPPALPSLPAPLAGEVHAARALASISVPLAPMKAERARTGASVNDLFMAAVTTGLRGYLSTKLDQVPDELFGLVPWNVRPDEGSNAAGNRTWSIHVPLPVGNPDAAERLAIVQDAVRKGKESQHTSGPAGWRFDVTLTNVPLGDGPRSVAGRRIEACPRTSAPLQGNNRLVACAVGFADTFSVTFIADGTVFPDIEALAAHTLDALMIRV